MKIDLQSIDREQFRVDEHILNGEVVYLVQPREIGVKWNQTNKIFRSSVWDSNGESVSLSFFKFPNWGENPENFPVPTSLKDCVFPQKIDGSTLIVSKYKGNFIIRTRGTLDASLMEKNGHEIELFKSTILSKLSDFDLDGFSWLFEWVSPLNRVVILYPEPAWYLIGIVRHSDYRLLEQKSLDVIASEREFKRPALYTFESFKDFNDIEATVSQWKGAEGIVIYSNNGQTLHKMKADDYLAKHRLKSELSSLEKLVDFWVSQGKPFEYQSFFNMIVDLVDYETACEHRGNISRIMDAWKEVQNVVKGITNFVAPLKNSLRKDAALSIVSSYGNTGRTNIAFTLLDSKPLTDDQYKKLLYQKLKNK